MEFTAEDIERTVARLHRRVEAIKIAGGISRQAVCQGTKIPATWMLDAETEFYVPPTFQFHDTHH